VAIDLLWISYGLAMDKKQERVRALQVNDKPAKNLAGFHNN